MLVGEKQYKLDELMPIYAKMMQEKDQGTEAEFVEAFKTFDREGQGYISSAELRHCITGMGECLVLLVQNWQPKLVYQLHVQNQIF